MSKYFNKTIFILTVIKLLFGNADQPVFNVFTSANKIGLGGSGSLQSSVLGNLTNPSSYLGKEFSVALIRYPADITSQSAGVVFPVLKGYGKFALNHISYGRFEQYDEDGIGIGNYNSHDTWFSTAYSNPFLKNKIKLGLSLSFYHSNYGYEKLNTFSLSYGMLYLLDNEKTKIGIILDRYGWAFGNSPTELNNKLVLGYSKRLAYLPLDLFIDAKIGKDNLEEIFVGGTFDLNKRFSFSIGSSSRKFSQNIEQKVSKTILGSTGAGLKYISGSNIFNYGIYIYPTGTLIHGLEIGTRF